MSLITLIHVPDGVVMACDTRTTIRTNTSVRYKDDCLDRMEDDICKVYHISQKDRCMYCDMFVLLYFGIIGPAQTHTLKSQKQKELLEQ